MKKPLRPDAQSVESLRQKITDLVGNDPQKAAIVLADWLKAIEKAPAKPAAHAAKKKAG